VLGDLLGASQSRTKRALAHVEHLRNREGIDTSTMAKPLFVTFLEGWKSGRHSELMGNTPIDRGLRKGSVLKLVRSWTARAVAKLNIINPDVNDHSDLRQRLYFQNRNRRGRLTRSSLVSPHLSRPVCRISGGLGLCAFLLFNGVHALSLRNATK
jgi:hypothetical protein